MLKAVLFDMDDTLLDWSGFDADWGAMEAAHLTRVVEHFRTELQFEIELTRFGTTMRERTIAAWTAARQDLRAPNLGAILVETARELGAPDSIDARRCLEHYGWGLVEGTVIFPDVPPLLDLLKKHGVQVGIVTNAYQPMWLREIELKAHQLLDYFPTCRISAADVGYLKPHRRSSNQRWNASASNLTRWCSSGMIFTPISAAPSVRAFAPSCAWSSARKSAPTG